MKPDPRYPPIAQPTEERTADPVPADADEDVVARTGRGEDTPRRYDEDADEDEGEDVRPADDSPLNSKI